MKGIWCLACFMLLLLITASPANAAEGHMKLLAVSEEPPLKGSIADLFLRTEPGSGRIFMETFPYTKLDTQISTKFAKEIACKEFDLSCDSYDFFYTLKAGSSIIGGPSAGAAIAALTAAVMKDLELRDDIALTGTINSGGLVGSVGGIKQKLEVAAENGIKKVLIPKGEGIIIENNETVNLTLYGRRLGLEVVEVGELSEAVFQFTGAQLGQASREIVIDETYRNVMRSLAMDLCQRSGKLKEFVLNRKPGEDFVTGNFLSDETAALNLTEKGLVALDNEAYYTSASYCFGANVKFRYLATLMQRYKPEDIREQIDVFEAEVKNFEASLPSYDTITDLQTFTVVRDRLAESGMFLNLSRVKLKGASNSSNISSSLNDLAYAIERFYSANSWAKFFGSGTKKFELSRGNLRNSCDNKLAEADERLQYARLFISGALEDISSELNNARQLRENGDYELCLFEALKAKATANIVLSVIGVGQGELASIVDYKLEAAKREIIKETEKGVFPIVGYSYYEYSKSLKDTDKFSALLYSEYALELSNLDIYFKEAAAQNLTVVSLPQRVVKVVSFSKSNIAPFVIGVVLGAIVAALVLSERGRKKVLLIRRR